MAQPFLENDFFRRYRRYYTYIEPITLDPLVRGYFTLIASMLLVTVFLIFALSPTLSTILGLIKKINDQKVLIGKMDTKIANLVAAQESLGQAAGSLPLLRLALPQKPTPETILPTILAVASSSGVVVNSVGLADMVLDVSGDFVQETSQVPVLAGIVLPHTSFTMAVAGSTEQTKMFMEKLEKTPRIIRISSIAVAPLGVSASPGIGISILGLAFYLPE